MCIEKLEILIGELENEATYLRYEARNAFNQVEKLEMHSEADGIETALIKIRKLLREETDVPFNQETRF